MDQSNTAMSWPGKSIRARLATAKAQPKGKAVVVPPPPRVVAPIRVAPAAPAAPAAPVAPVAPVAPAMRGKVLSPPRAAKVPQAPPGPPTVVVLRASLLAVVKEETECFVEMAPW
jgi:hypothetical protein